ncbi:MAG: hypothetical protein H6738_01360 [Alphaproteobacteria bacterium]|nr:hypothetical protein [Alphaproteobacteria bacterium]MCB9695415.1 hypothetical protein [Alphaproteobacteria bacterium]
MIQALLALAHAEPTRLAVVLSSDQGRPGEERLEWADSDGERVVDVLTELGGFDAAHVWRVPGATVDSATAALGQAVLAASEARGRGEEIELLVYYTGHAASDGLHLGDEVMSMSSLKTAARVVPADQRVFVVDACQAGTLLRSKGASLVKVTDAPEEFTPPADEAWIASAGAEESAFEVDRRRGALFTHFFVSGARGAADTDHDGVVTLGELYGFVRARTTEEAAGLGYVQEPRWAGELGRFVVSRPAGADSGVQAEGPIDVPLLLVDERRGAVVAEIPAGAGTRLAVPGGRYQVVALEGGERVRVGELEVPAHGFARASVSVLRAQRGVRTRGGLVDTRPGGLAAGYLLTTGRTPGRVDGHGLFVEGRRAVGRGLDLVIGAQGTWLPFRTDALAGTDGTVGASVGGRWDLLPGPLRLGPTADVGAGWLWQSVARAPDPVWGTWYGEQSAERSTSVGLLTAHGGVGLDLPAGPIALVGSVSLGPSVALASRPTVAPDLAVRVGVERTLRGGR